MKRPLIIILAVIMVLSLCSCGEKICEECNGSETISCTECGGTGRIDCPEEDCNNGITGTSCNNCGGRGGIETCFRCEGSGKESRSCETCGGDGNIINPFTWEKFQCGNCDYKHEAVYQCDFCGGHGLICNYCRANLSTYPHSKYHPYYIECNTCSGSGSVECDVCRGAKEFPCPVCSAEAHQEFIAQIDAEKNSEERALEEENLIEEVLVLLTGISKDHQSYQAEYTNLETLLEAKDILNSYDGEFEKKTRLLRQIDAIIPYIDSEWILVDGDSSFFSSKSDVEFDGYVIKDLRYSRDKKEFMIYIYSKSGDEFYRGELLYLKLDEPFLFEYWNTSSAYTTGTLTEQDTLLFEYSSYTKDYSKRKVTNSCELARKNSNE